MGTSPHQFIARRGTTLPADDEERQQANVDGIASEVQADPGVSWLDVHHEPVQTGDLHH